MEKYAHVNEAGERQPLSEHLLNTARLAGGFGTAFDAADLAAAAGVLHDIGKGSKEFQKRLFSDGEKVDHSTAGAIEIQKWCMGTLAENAVAGHHAGILGNLDLERRMKKKIAEYDPPGAEERKILENLSLPEWLFEKTENYQRMLFCRMVFSCVADADFLDTEEFMRSKKPRGGCDSIYALSERLKAKTDTFLNAENLSELDKERNRVLEKCIKEGKSTERGLYTLTVPTGGGKTFSSLSFALEHAAKNGLSRVIYIVPYTAIIDQTAEAFIDVLGQKNVLPHYSDADYMSEEEGDDPEKRKRKYLALLASENWDVSVIVTTAVQFFESLHSHKPVKCRKLHNIANSVIVFDEAQTLPMKFLTSCVFCIAELVKHYNATAVLCTATQPALDGLFKKHGLEAKELYPDFPKLYRKLKRTKIKDAGELEREELAKRLIEEKQVLCVVNLREEAQRLYGALPEEGRYCLTTLLTPTDRKAKFAEIRQRLERGETCRVVSTSLIEAGVDLDFPAAYREEAGLDSVIQTAGRCNREGKKDSADVFTFKLKDAKEFWAIKTQLKMQKYVRRQFDDPEDPECVKKYFLRLFGLNESALDKAGILKKTKEGVKGEECPFKEIDESFKIIESSARTVYVPSDEKGKELCEKLLKEEPGRGLYRKCGAYGIPVYQKAWGALIGSGSAAELENGAGVLLKGELYSRETGLKADFDQENRRK